MIDYSKNAIPGKPTENSEADIVGDNQTIQKIG